MRMKFISAGMLCLFVIVTSCDTKQSHSDSDPNSIFSVARPILEDAQKFLIRNPEWMTSKNLLTLTERSLSLTEAFESIRQSGLPKVTDSLPNIPQITIDGVTYSVHIELFNEGIIDTSTGLLKKGTTVEDYGVGLDPDEFESNEVEDVITIQILRSDNTIESLTLKNADFENPYPADNDVQQSEAYDGLGLTDAYNQQIRDGLAYPVFILTLNEDSPDILAQINVESNSESSSSSPSTLYPWLEIHQINLYITHEGGDPEFEMYFTNGRVNPSYFSNVGHFGRESFDGRNAYNPSNSDRIIYIRNVNHPNENFSDPYLVHRLDIMPSTSTSEDGFGLCFIENDYRAKETWKQSNYTDPESHYTFYRKFQRYIKLPSLNGQQHYELYSNTYQSGINQDDFYVGEIMGLNEENVDQVLESRPHFYLPVWYRVPGQLVSDLSVKFDRGYYPYQ